MWRALWVRAIQAVLLSVAGRVMVARSDETAHRATVEALLKAADRNERLADLLASDLLASISTAEIGGLRSHAENMRQQAAHHLRIAESLCSKVEDDPEGPKIGSMLTAAGVIAAVALPGGVTLGAAAIAAAPHLGIDPLGDGSAYRRVCATLRRDDVGQFGFVIREDEAGLYLASIHANVQPDFDERALLREGDRLYSLDGAQVRAVRDVASEERSSAVEAAAALGIGLDDARKLVRASGAAITVEVYREEVRPLSERLHRTKDHFQGEVERAIGKRNVEQLKRQASSVSQQVEERFKSAHAAAQALLLSPSGPSSLQRTDGGAAADDEQARRRVVLCTLGVISAGTARDDRARVTCVLRALGAESSSSLHQAGMEDELRLPPVTQRC